MARIQLKNVELLAALNALSALSEWVRPGKLGLVLGQIRYPLQAPAQLITDEREKLRVDCVVMVDSDDGPQPKTRMTAQGERYVFKNEEDFAKRDRDILNEEVTVDVPRLLTESDVEKIEQDIEKGKGRKSDVLPSVDFAALMPVMQV